MRSFDRRAGDHHRGRASVVSDWQMGVVWLQGVCRPAEHAADVICVVSASIEVGVIADLHGQVHRRFR